MFDITFNSFLKILKIHLGHFLTALSMYILKISKSILVGEMWTEILAKYLRAIILKVNDFSNSSSKSKDQELTLFLPFHNNKKKKNKNTAKIYNREISQRSKIILGQKNQDPQDLVYFGRGCSYCYKVKTKSTPSPWTWNWSLTKLSLNSN